jgi:hypothetical protein
VPPSLREARSPFAAVVVVHQAGAIAISVALFLLYGNLVPAATLDPILGTASVGILLGLLLMLYMVIRSGTENAPA